MSDLSSWGVDREKGAPYNPPIADERGAKRRQALKQVSEDKEEILEFRVRFSE